VAATSSVGDPRQLGTRRFSYSPKGKDGGKVLPWKEKTVNF